MWDRDPLYNQTMARATNAISHRFVSIVCLLAMLLVAVPPANCAPVASSMAAGMPAASCDPCCPTPISATAPCCLTTPQPPEPLVQPAAHPIALVASECPTLLIERLASQRIPDATVLRIAFLPLLHPILRI